MKPFYWKGTRNFGDYLNTWLWPRLLPEFIDEDMNTRLVGVGSLLKSSLNLVQGKKLIFGTGSGYGAVPSPDLYKDWSFYFVRGPMTAECFNLPKKKSIVDGAWLIGLLPEYKSFKSKQSGVVFVPHWSSAESGNWRKPCSIAGIDYIDPESDLEGIFGKIASSELVITESLHGAIIADLFRVPWIPVRMSPDFLPFKWLDWFKSIELEGQITPLPLSDLFDHLYHRTSPRNLDYSARPQPIPSSEVLVESKKYESPGRLYSFKIRSKKTLRAARKDLLNSCKTIRGIFPLSVWNEAHCNKLAEALGTVSKGNSFLSNDSVWNLRMEQLHGVTEELKSDIASGNFENSSKI
jgi:succinoglycan biosynthesis protein ExoV